MLVYCIFMDETFELLGNSQTFLGVLATIIMLFIIEDKSNLISYILTEIGEKLNEQIKALTVTTSLEESVQQSANYKLLRYFMDRENVTKSLHDEGAELLAKITTERANFQTKYIEVENPNLINPKIIVKAKEILLAPLYTFFFTIAIFVFDEILRFKNIPPKITISALLCFIILSYVYWILLWLKYFLKFYKFDKCGIPKEESKKSLFNYWSKTNLQMKTIFCFIFMLLFFSLFQVINAYFQLVDSWTIIVFGLIVPFGGMGIFMLKNISNKSDYSYVFMCGHYVLIICLSLIVVCSCYILSNVLELGENPFIQYQSLGTLKCLIFVFALLNGIIFPFIFPYITYYRFYKYVKLKTNESQNEANSVIASINDKLEEFVKKIPSPE